MVSFKADTKHLQNTLKLVKGAVHGKSAKTLSVTCEITITDGKATFAVPGAVFSLDCITKGTCKATIPFLQFSLIVKDVQTIETEITITEGSIKIQRVTINAQTTFFKTDSILRTIQLPINYTDADLLRLRKQGYTQEELEFNNLAKQIDIAHSNLDSNLLLAAKILKQYDVPYEALEKLAKEKL